MAGALGVCAAAVAGSVVPGLDLAVGVVLVAAALAAVGVAVLRRERRIRARIADTDGARYWPHTSGGPAQTRVGPGEHAPAPPAPTGPPARALAVVPADPTSSPAGPVAGRPCTPSGGAA